MARVNIYLPDALYVQVKELKVNMSSICQKALEYEVPYLKCLKCNYITSKYLEEPYCPRDGKLLQLINQFK